MASSTKCQSRFMGFLMLNLLTLPPVHAAERVVNLVIHDKSVHFTSRKSNAIAINQQIPSPVLHFKEGDHVTLHVTNQLDKETALHWHGMLVPWQMDGVLGISQRGIQPGHQFTYQFTLHQSGTYWYHAHAGLQEQQGLYGAFIIDPLKPSAYHYNKDFTVVLSDWSDTKPTQILANLKKSGDYYSPRFPLQASLSRFIHDYRKASAHERQQILADYNMMQTMRMGLYDISDVAYDAFLLNGQSNKTPWTGKVKLGDVVRLRFIGAGGSTIFRVKVPGTSMKMVHIEGNDVKPYDVNDFTIAPGETYDVLITIKEAKPYIIYAESRDTLGAAMGALITSPHQIVPYQSVTPFKAPAPAMRHMMDMKQDSPSPHTMPMNMSGMAHTAILSDLSNTNYQPVIAAVKTNDPTKPITETLPMRLSGYMGRYIWMINGVPEFNAKPILLNPGKRYRFIFTNDSMMRHPMHLHGHWFILRKGNGAYDPLLHTIDVPPHATITADVDTDASGQWFFHCHLLYHMMTGMARVFQYSTLIDITQGDAKPQHLIQPTPYHNRPIIRVDEIRPIDQALVKHPMAHPQNLWYATLLNISADPFNNIQKLTYKGLYGSDYHKLQLFTNDAEIDKGTVENADLDIFYWQLLNQFWAIKGGINYFYRPASTPYWQGGIGIEGLMPYFIEVDARTYYYAGSAKLDLSFARDTQLTNNVFIRAEIRGILASQSNATASIGSGLNQMRYLLRPYYRVAPGISLYAEYEHEKDYGAFKQYQRTADEPLIQHTVSFGVSWLF
ncbi:MAG: copper oxidase [Gammaproteobacteria bacterium RIFCSPHIGHO2_12_FULL_45_12]|nr:MAG: copper oxidase [Gammaproteobacteria bacterium RIFCSPHIGHO2_12_FULL_45_12]